MPHRQPRTSAKQVRVLDMELRAWTLRIHGWSLEAIGQALGDEHARQAAAAGKPKPAKPVARSTVHELLKRRMEYLREHVLPELAEQETLAQLDRLNEATRLVMKEIRAGDLKAVHALVRLEERRAKLVGLDAPERVEHTGPAGHALRMDVESRMLAARLSDEDLQRLVELSAKVAKPEEQ